MQHSNSLFLFLNKQRSAGTIRKKEKKDLKLLTEYPVTARDHKILMFSASGLILHAGQTHHCQMRQDNLTNSTVHILSNWAELSNFDIN